MKIENASHVASGGAQLQTPSKQNNLSLDAFGRLLQLGYGVTSKEEESPAAK
jgi:hypothetical protein